MQWSNPAVPTTTAHAPKVLGSGGGKCLDIQAYTAHEKFISYVPFFITRAFGAGIFLTIFYMRKEMYLDGIMCRMTTKTITSLEELSLIAKDILNMCVPSEVASCIALSGDLGAGKTAFVKELAKHLGVTQEVTSPTFVVMKSYSIIEHSSFKTLTHIDAYRIDDEDEMRVLGLYELLKDPARLVCIEWPERIKNCIPENAINIHIALSQTDNTRVLEYAN